MSDLQTRIESRFQKKPNLKDAKRRSRTSPEVIKEESEIPSELIGIGKNKTYYIQTFGCQMNEHDTEVMAGLLEVLGYTYLDDEQKADIVIFNTCAIRENAENRVFGRLGNLKKVKLEHPEKIFAVCGCMSQEENVVNKLLEKYSFVDLIFGTHNIHRLPQLLQEAMQSKAMIVEVWSKEGDIIEALPKVRASNTKAWVNIIYGCDKFCTYCIVPYTRGKERSRMPQDVIDEVKELVEKGYQEITLLGQNVNAYGKDLKIGYKMSDLLENVAKLGMPRLRFTTSHPWDFDSEMIDVIAKYDNIMPHIHLPVQSGNNEILKIMGRTYTKERYLELFDEIKRKVKDVIITTDIIVGYPNETKEQFEETLNLYDYCQFDAAYTFIYSPREGTPGARMEDNVSTEEKKQRLYKLNEYVNHYAKESNNRQIGKVLKVLVDGPSVKDEEILAGYSEGLKLVHFKGSKELIGKIVEVKITDARKFNLMGELVENN